MLKVNLLTVVESSSSAIVSAAAAAESVSSSPGQRCCLWRFSLSGEAVGCCCVERALLMGGKAVSTYRSPTKQTAVGIETEGRTRSSKFCLTSRETKALVVKASRVRSDTGMTTHETAHVSLKTSRLPETVVVQHGGGAQVITCIPACFQSSSVSPPDRVQTLIADRLISTRYRGGEQEVGP